MPRLLSVNVGLPRDVTWNGKTAMGKMMFTVLAAVGELERNLIVERVRCGMRNAKAIHQRGSTSGYRHDLRLVAESTGFQVNSTSRRIALETHHRCLDAIANGETEGAEFDVWWDRLARLNQDMAGPQTRKRVKEITEKMVGGKEPEAGRDDGGLY
jgi:hypothetical protein